MEWNGVMAGCYGVEWSHDRLLWSHGRLLWSGMESWQAVIVMTGCNGLQWSHDRLLCSHDWP